MLKRRQVLFQSSPSVPVELVFELVPSDPLLNLALFIPEKDRKEEGEELDEEYSSSEETAFPPSAILLYPADLSMSN